MNIHVRPLICTVQGCTYTKPFGKSCDLKRHIDGVHKRQLEFKCPVDSCDASITSFSRKDKLLKHMREYHDHVKCLLNHCGAGVLAGNEESHLQYGHGDLECQYGACALGPPSRFSRQGLEKHFRIDHYIYYNGAYFASMVADNEKSYDLERLIKVLQKSDCQACLQYTNVDN